MDFPCQGEELRVGFTVDVKRPILSVSSLMDRGIETFIQADKQILRDSTVRLLNSHVVVVSSFCNVKLLFRCCWHLWIWEPAGEAPDLPFIDEEMECELMGREEMEPQVAIEVPSPDEPTSDERRHHGLTHLPHQLRCNICVRARGRENRHVSRSQNQPGTPIIQCDYRFLKTEEDVPMVTILVDIDTL